jgi:hypothetical protein
VAVGETGEHVERRAGDQAHALRRDPFLAERLLRQPLVLGLGVHGGEDAVGAHAAQQPEPGDPRAGADLHHRTRVGHGREEPQHGTAAAADRNHADLLGARPGSREDVVLADELLGVGPAGRLQSRGDDYS